ncbi:MAG: 4Fe-4S binding protein [Acidobacteriota bacterium]
MKHARGAPAGKSIQVTHVISVLRRLLVYAVIPVICTGVPMLLEWATTSPPTERKVHIEAFRYGTSPSIIRANRGDKLTLTFATRDTGHSFFLQDYRVEAKISPASEKVEVVDPFRSAEPPHHVRELRLTVGKPGLWGSLTSRSRFRCHIYCGPMHGFEQGDLIVRPNYLLWGSLGVLASIILIGLCRVHWDPPEDIGGTPPPLDINKRFPWVGELLRWRPLQFVGTMPVLAGFTLIILAGLFGTKVGGRNLAIMMTWVVWMTLLTLVLVPLSTRTWCLVCPLPALGEFLQRGALTQVRRATKPGRFGNRFLSLGRRWPRPLRGPWLRTLFFVGLGCFSASLAGQPRWTAYLLLSLAAMAIFMAVVWELRAFCRYLCPAASFISPSSAVGRLMVRNRNDAVCRNCKDKPCLTGNADGWACSYGLYVPKVTGNSECGVCTECFKSCPHDNITLSWRRSPWRERFSSYGEAWQAIVLVALAMTYSLTVHSPWPGIRDMSNLVDKATWPEFALYAASVAGLALGVVPLIFWLAVGWGRRLADRATKSRGGEESISDSATGAVFKRTTPALIPLGLGLWAAFFAAVVMVNFTFVLYTLSDPFGWGWNLLGTSGMPWIQVWPSAIPWLQSAAILTGVALSMRQGYRLWLAEKVGKKAALYGFAPTAAINCSLAAGMLVYFTHF